MLVHSPLGRRSQLGRVEAGARSVTQVFTSEAGAQVFGSCSAVCPRVLTAGWEVEQLGQELTPTLDASIAGGFTTSATVFRNGH